MPVACRSVTLGRRSLDAGMSYAALVTEACARVSDAVVACRSGLGWSLCVWDVISGCDVTCDAVLVFGGGGQGRSCGRAGRETLDPASSRTS